MTQSYYQKLSKGELSWAIHIVTANDKNMSSEEIQKQIKFLFKTNVPISNIKTYFAERGKDDYDVEHRKVRYGISED